MITERLVSKIDLNGGRERGKYLRTEYPEPLRFSKEEVFEFRAMVSMKVMVIDVVIIISVLQGESIGSKSQSV